MGGGNFLFLNFVRLGFTLFGFCSFDILSIGDFVRSGFCRFGILSIRDFVHLDLSNSGFCFSGFCSWASYAYSYAKHSIFGWAYWLWTGLAVFLSMETLEMPQPLSYGTRHLLAVGISQRPKLMLLWNRETHSKAPAFSTAAPANMWTRWSLSLQHHYWKKREILKELSQKKRESIIVYCITFISPHSA